MRPPEAAHVHGDVGDVPAETVQIQQQGPRGDTGQAGVGVQHGPIARVEAPQVTLGRGGQGGVPVDEHPAAAGQHRVAGMRFAVGEDGPGGLGAGGRHEMVVAGEEPPDGRGMLLDQACHRAGVGSHVQGAGPGLAGGLQLVPVRHGEVVSQRTPAGRGRGGVRGGQQVEHGQPVRGGGERRPVEALAVNERVDRQAEPGADPREQLAVPGRNRRHRERGAAVPQVGGGAQSRAQPPEAASQRLGLRHPFVLQVIRGDEPP